MKSKRFFVSVIILAVILLCTSVTVFTGCNTSAAVALKKMSNSDFELITDDSYKNDIDYNRDYPDFSSAFLEGQLEFNMDSAIPFIRFGAYFNQNKYFAYNTFQSKWVYKSDISIPINHYFFNEVYSSGNDISVLFKADKIEEDRFFISLRYYKDENILKLSIDMSMQIAEVNSNNIKAADYNSLNFVKGSGSFNLFFKPIAKTDGTIRIGTGGGDNNNPPVGDSKYQKIQNAYIDAGYEIDPSWINESEAGEAYLTTKNIYSALGKTCFITKGFETLDFEIYMLMDVGNAAIAAETAQAFEPMCKQRDRYIIASLDMLNSNYDPFYSAFD